VLAFFTVNANRWWGTSTRRRIDKELILRVVEARGSVLIELGSSGAGKVHGERNTMLS
jgi:hypothetical protein